MLLVYSMHDCRHRLQSSKNCGMLNNIQTLKLSGAVKKGDRIAQLILERIMTPEVEEVEELDSTIRGSGGYGSTGVAN